MKNYKTFEQHDYKNSKGELFSKVLQLKGTDKVVIYLYFDMNNMYISINFDK